jgi:hypothetical protein
MSEDSSRTNCFEFQNQLSDLLGTEVDIGNHPHVKACETCAALVYDIHRIAEDAKHRSFGLEEE